LKYDNSGNSETVSGQGRGIVDADTFFSGTFTGVWKRDGSNIIMRNLVNIFDGTTNFDSIVVNTDQRNVLYRCLYRGLMGMDLKKTPDPFYNCLIIRIDNAKLKI
jgi:hypothetical protein